MKINKLTTFLNDYIRQRQRAMFCALSHFFQWIKKWSEMSSKWDNRIQQLYPASIVVVMRRFPPWSGSGCWRPWWERRPCSSNRYRHLHASRTHRWRSQGECSFCTTIHRHHCLYSSYLYLCRCRDRRSRTSYCRGNSVAQECSRCSQRRRRSCGTRFRRRAQWTPGSARTRACPPTWSC